MKAIRRTVRSSRASQTQPACHPNPVVVFIGFICVNLRNLRIGLGSPPVSLLWRIAVGSLRREGEDPDVAEADGTAVVLEGDGAGAGFLSPAGGAGGPLDLGVVLDGDAVLENGDAGLLGALAGRVEARRAEEDIERLPLQRRLADR